MEKDGLLIQSKLRLPFVRRSLVDRPRLQARFDEGIRGPLMLITAPAGFGKTTLAASCVAGCGLPFAWLSLDKDDNQPGRFLTYLAAALQAADERIGGQAAQLLAGINPAAPEAVMTSLINDLQAAGGELVLVLDDYQLIHAPVVHEQLTFLLEHCPASLHLVIATRSDPPLPLSRLRARGQTVELRAVDLRFNADEAAQFLEQVMDLRLDGEAVALLDERTEGWAAGLQMAALSMRGRPDTEAFIREFAGTNRFIMDFMLEEVLAREPHEVQDFLLQTAVLTRLAGPLCDALTGGTGGQEMLETLERRNLFVVPLDEERRWYRYHHLFADLLQARLRQTQPDLAARLLMRASQWLEQNGYIPDAVRYAFAAEETGRAADLIERYGPARLEQSDPSVVQMADDLPQEMIQARPLIGLYQAWLLICQSRIPQARLLMSGLAGQLSARDAGSGRGWMQTWIAAAVAFLAPPADFEACPLPAEDLLEAVPAGELILRNAADFLYGMALARRGQMERAVQVALACIQRERTHPANLAVPTLVPFLTRVYLMQGKFNAAAALCREFLDPQRGKNVRFIYTSGSIKIDLGEVLYEWNCLEEAEPMIREGLRANEPWRNIMTDGFGLAALTRVLLAQGRFGEALQAMERFEARLLEHPHPREFDEDLLTLRVRIQLAGGNLHNPSAWAEQVVHNPDFESHKEIYRLTLARIWSAQGRHAEVERLLDGFIPPFSANSQLTRQIEAGLLRAAALAGQQRLEEAFNQVESCLSLAEPEGSLRVFLNGGEPVRDLLSAYLRSGAAGRTAYARRVLEAFGQPGGPVSHPAGLVEALSGRELEVLRLMETGKSNAEIARQLVVAPGTIKAHAASIYRKLEAANRTEAVARARLLGILT